MIVDPKALALEELTLRERHLELVEGVPHLYGWKFYPWARKFFESTNRENILCSANQISKAQCVDSVAPTPSGMRRFGDLKVGDEVFGRDGKATTILAIPFEGECEAFQITFGDGSRTIASDEHLWITKGYRERFRKSYIAGLPRAKNFGQQFPNKTYGQWKTLSTKEIIAQGQYCPTAKPTRRFSVPLCSAVEYPERNLFDPYLVGQLLGDGGLTGRSVILTSADQETVDYIRVTHNAKHSGGKYGYRLNGLQGKMKELGLMGKGSAAKFIPVQYKLSSTKQRQALLQGLFDADAHIKANGTIIYSTASEQLCNDVIEVVTSLGGVAKLATRHTAYKKDGVKKMCKLSYGLNVKIPVNPFRLTRKAKYFRAEVRYKSERVIRRIDSIGKRAMRCITVSNADGSYLTGKEHICTHNSSTQIRKVIHWATAQDLWPALWPRKPLQFWYLYPTYQVATIEFKKKWIPEFMPRGKFKDDPVYGWNAEIRNGVVAAVHFNSGVSVYFKTYAMDIQDLQSGSVDAVWLDEEPVENILPELQMRLVAKGGYFHAVFTPTLGQEVWRCAIEEIGKKAETFKGAFKQQVSMYDCLYYEDGTRSPWTLEAIQRAERACKSEAQIQRRVYGRFVSDEGLKYPSFERGRNLIEGDGKPPPDWDIVVGADVGSGGDNHPAAIVFIAVSPDRQKGVVFKGWRGDDCITTAGDVVHKVIQLAAGLKVSRIFYDWASKDFYNNAQSMGLNVEAAEKNHAVGEQVVNVLFKNRMLSVHDLSELEPLCVELTTLKAATPKRNAKDDYCDALRYACTKVDWDWSILNAKPVAEKAKERTEREDRREFVSPTEAVMGEYEGEIEEWNYLYHSSLD